jgi:hypothetical protein
MNCVSFSGSGENFSLLQNIQTGYGDHPAANSVLVIGFLKCKAVGFWSWPLSSSLCRGEILGDFYIQYPICLHEECGKTFNFITANHTTVTLNVDPASLLPLQIAVSTTRDTSVSEKLTHWQAYVIDLGRTWQSTDKSKCSCRPSFQRHSRLKYSRILHHADW